MRDQCWVLEQGPEGDGSWEKKQRTRRQKRVRRGIRWMDLSDLEQNRAIFSVLVSSVSSSTAEPPPAISPWIWSFELGDPSDWRCMTMQRDRNEKRRMILESEKERKKDNGLWASRILYMRAFLPLRFVLILAGLGQLFLKYTWPLFESKPLIVYFLFYFFNLIHHK